MKLSLLALLACGSASVKLTGDLFGDDTGAGTADSDGDGYPGGGDCDDGDRAVNPGADELCDGIDNDCDGAVDESGAVDAGTWYADRDGDGWGDDEPIYACEQPADTAASTGDCDDGDPAVHPDGGELCDGVDNDCDGVIDGADALDATAWYPDEDGDLWGESGAGVIACEPPGEGWSDVGGDCDDTESAVNPGASEICRDGLDNDCDGTASGCELVGEQSLIEARSVTLYGNSSHDSAGRALAVGDSDGDGRLDMAIGADDDDRGGADAGAVYVVIGPAEAGDSSLLAAAAQVFTGAEAGEELGAVLAFSDLDGDGEDELLIGAPLSAGGAGAAYVTDRSADGDLGAGAARATVLGALPGDGVGAAIAALRSGDEPLAELFVGGAGSVYGFAGPLLGAVPAGAAELVIGGEGLGETVVRAGDVDGDGYEDLLLGAAHDSEGGDEAGAVWLFLGPVSASAVADADATWLGAAGDRAGASAAGGGDLDGDGLSDLLVGAPGSDESGVDAGAVSLITDIGGGALADSAGRLLGEADFDRAGEVVCMAGDVNGDGAGDVLVGVPVSDAAGYDAGAAWLIYGPVSGASALSEHPVLRGAAAQDEAGSSLAGGGDLDGDSYADFLVGAAAESTAGSSAGAVYLISGGGW